MRADPSRECNKCNQVFPSCMFYRTQSHCKACDKVRNQSRKGRSAQDVFKNNTDAARNRKNKWAKGHRDPVREAAYMQVRSALAKGILVRPDNCSSCGGSQVRRDGVTAIHAHHHLGYTNPLSIVWLCAKCHDLAHAAISNAAEEGE